MSSNLQRRMLHIFHNGFTDLIAMCCGLCANLVQLSNNRCYIYGISRFCTGPGLTFKYQTGPVRFLTHTVGKFTQQVKYFFANVYIWWCVLDGSFPKTISYSIPKIEISQYIALLTVEQWFALFHMDQFRQILALIHTISSRVMHSYRETKRDHMLQSVPSPFMQTHSKTTRHLIKKMNFFM